MSEEDAEERPVAMVDEIDPADVDIKTKIGEGTTASVFVGQYKGEQVAVKEMWIQLSSKGQSDFEYARREFCMLSVVIHPNIVRLIGLIRQANPVRLVLEYCAGGSLFDLLHNQRKVKCSWVQRLKILLDTARAMEYLHNFDPPIIHRDMKSLNLLLMEPVISQRVSPHVKLGDFGLARVQDEAMTVGVGTKHWMAPEVLCTSDYTEKADIFSYAMVAYEVVCNHVPFERLEPQIVAKKLSTGMRPKFEDHIKNFEAVPSGLLDIITDCWEQDEENRPISSEIVRRVRRLVMSTPDVVSL